MTQAQKYVNNKKSTILMHFKFILTYIYNNRTSFFALLLSLAYATFWGLRQFSFAKQHLDHFPVSDKKKRHFYLPTVMNLIKVKTVKNSIFLNFKGFAYWINAINYLLKEKWKLLHNHYDQHTNSVCITSFDMFLWKKFL